MLVQINWDHYSKVVSASNRISDLKPGENGKTVSFNITMKQQPTAELIKQ